MSVAVLVGSPFAGVLAGKFKVPQRYLIQAGLLIAVAGAVLLRLEVSATATALSFMPGLLCFGFGFGLLIAQLSNTTLSAVSVQVAGEASGVNNTFRQIGTSMGQALIGALLISALAAQLSHDVSASKVLPPPLKPQVTAAVAASAQSLGTTSADPSKNLPAPAVKEILRIKNDAIVKSVKTGFEGTIAATIVAFFLSFMLPRRAQQHEYDAPAAK